MNTTKQNSALNQFLTRFFFEVVFMKILVIVAASLLVFFSALNAVNVDAMQSQQNARHALIEAI